MLVDYNTGFSKGHFRVVCEVPWSLNRSEAVGDLVLLNLFPVYELVSMRITQFALEKQKDL